MITNLNGNNIIYVDSGQSKKRLQYTRNSCLGNLTRAAKNVCLIRDANVFDRQEYELTLDIIDKLSQLNSLLRSNKGNNIKIVNIK